MNIVNYFKELIESISDYRSQNSIINIFNSK